MTYQSNQSAKLIKPASAPPRFEKPAPPPPRFPRALLDGLIGKRIVIQERGGKAGAPMIIGRLTAVDGYLLRIDESEIRGVRNAVRPPFVIVNIGQVSHLHPECEAVALEPEEAEVA